MNRKLVAISIGILFVLSLNTVAAMNERDPEIRIDEINEGEAAINFKIPNFFNYDEYFMLENFTGKLLMLDLMAAWCGPCNDAMPEMKELYDVYGGSGVFEILSIAVDEGEPRADLDYDDREKLWVGDVKFELVPLYNADTVELKYKATDYFDNTVETTAQSYPVEFVEDTKDPSLTNFKPRHDYFGDESIVKVNADALDNYEIKSVELLENTGTVTTRFPFTYAFGPTWVVAVEYDVDLDITGYTYEVIATDIAGNTYTESSDFELTAPTEAAETVETNSTTPVDTNTETTPAHIAPFIFTIVAIPILRKRDKRKRSI